MSDARSRTRLTVVGVVVLALFSALLARLWFLQVANSQSYTAQTEENRIRVVREPAVRGALLDHKGRVIVQNSVVDAITVRRDSTDEELKVALPNLATLLGISVDDVRKRMEDVRYSPYAPAPVAEKVSFDKLVYVKQHPEQFPGVSATQLTIREYPSQPGPYGPVGAHVIGYLGTLNKREAKIHEGEGYGPIDQIGKLGAEAMFETELKGTPGERRLEVDALGRLVRVDSETASVPGNDVVTTLDLDVQRILEESIAQMVDSLRGKYNPGIRSRFATFDPKAAAGIVLDATDGSIVALSSWPTFNLDELARGNVPSSLLSPESGYPFVDRVLQGQYAPGSTFKTFTAIAALQNGVTDPTRTVDDSRGCIVINRGLPSQQERCNAGKRPHGFPNLETALRVSSDVYFYIMGLDTYRAYCNRGEPDPNDPAYDAAKCDSLQSVARSFGFGSSTSSGITDEADGRVPDAQWKKAFGLANGLAEQDYIWLPGDLMSFAVGQGDLTVTPMQLAVAYAAFANGGTLWTPRLGARVQTVNADNKTEVVRELPSLKAGKADLPPEIRDLLVPGLAGVVCSPDGTAAMAFEGYGCGEAAGKTGTAQVTGSNVADNALFCGWTPMDPPADAAVHQYVVCIVIEAAGFGGSAAAPVARRVMDAVRFCLPNPDPAAPCDLPPVRYVPQTND